MKKSGICDLPLHYGRAPAWLFKKMKILAREISQIIIAEYGTKEFLKRISNPYFFQSFGCVIGFDWHSSGLTTTVCGALKESKLEELGIFITGGKGRTSTKTPEEIVKIGHKFGINDKKIEKMVYASKITAKIDNSVLQDNYTLYHHTFIFDENGNWAVIQQGMNENSGFARRYHWLSFNLKNFVMEPHEAICAEKTEPKVLNLVSRKSKETQNCIVDLINEKNLGKWLAPKNSLIKYLRMPAKHEIDKFVYQKILELQNFSPSNFEELIGIRGVGAKTIRALALISKLVYGSEIDWKDPAKYSFAHGGKDGIPYPVDIKNYEKTIKFLEDIVQDSSINRKEKQEALKRLYTKTKFI